MTLPEIEGSGDKAEAFFAQEEKILSDLAGSSHFFFRRGKGWSIDPETGESTYDPNFFQDKGFTASQALFASFHEIKCHFVEIAELRDREGGEEVYRKLKDRSQRKKRVHVWENCRTDIKGNLAIIQFAPSLAESAETLYREKLWPERDLTSKPRHLQFMYAILRESMVSSQQVSIDSKVREAIDSLRSVKGRDGKERDVIALATNPRQDPLIALRLSMRYIEPVIDKLFEEDVKDRQNQKSKPDRSQEGEGYDEAETDDWFSDEYEDYEENRHPEPMDDEEVDEKIRERERRQSTSQRQRTGYESEHGIRYTDAANYQRDYKKIEWQIEPYREIFRRIASQRLVIIRHLAALKEEGIMIDPGLVAQTYMDVKAGIPNPRTMKEFEGVVIPENVPKNADIYFVKDQSGSMAGEKARAQRLGTVVELEALQEGEDMMVEAELPDVLSLNINTAFLGFGFSEGARIYKPLSRGLTESQRIALYKGLLQTHGGTNDYDAMVFIENEIKYKMNDPVFTDELKSGKRKVVVIVTTDGGSTYRDLEKEQARAQTRGKVEDLRKLGIKVKAIALVPQDEDRENIVEVYGAGDTTICPSADKYYESTKTILEKDVLGELSITGNVEDIIQGV